MKVRAKDNILIMGRHVSTGAKIDIPDSLYAKYRDAVDIVTEAKTTKPVVVKKIAPIVLIPESAKEAEKTDKTDKKAKDVKNVKIDKKEAYKSDRFKKSY